MQKLKSSGSEEKFATGAVRDTATDKPRPDLISPFFKMRVGAWLQAGAVRYAPRNWEKGIGIERCFASLERHLVQWQLGMDDEDHLAAAACNLMFIIHNEEAVKHGILPPEIDNMPKYLKKKVEAGSATT